MCDAIIRHHLKDETDFGEAAMMRWFVENDILNLNQETYLYPLLFHFQTFLGIDTFLDLDLICHFQQTNASLLLHQNHFK
jgi:hypothetical protein